MQNAMKRTLREEISMRAALVWAFLAVAVFPLCATAQSVVNEPALSADGALEVATAALSYRMPSADYGKRAAEAKGVAIGPQLLPNITTAAGGLPIRAGGAVIGAVGVSGTPGSAGGGEGDAKCAEAGISKVK